MSSDNVSILSLTSNLNAAQVHTTEKVILSQYVALNILPKADQNMRIVLQFSPDGTNWDYNVATNVVAGENKIISNPVVGKWMRLIITNQGGVATTFLRVFVYATPTNSVLSAQLSKIGNLNPVIDVGNLPQTGYGSLNVAELKNKYLFNFDKGVSGSFLTEAWEMPYRGFRSVGSVGSSYFLEFSDGFVQNTGNLPGTQGLFEGPHYPWRSNNAHHVRFSAKYKQDVKSPIGLGAMWQLIGCGNSDMSAVLPENLVAFGYGDSTLPSSSQDSFGVLIVRDGFWEFIPRTSWLDPGDGTGILPVLDFEHTLNYGIELVQGGGSVKFSIMNPNTGFMVEVYHYNGSNQDESIMFTDRNMAFTFFTGYDSLQSVPLSLGDQMSCGGYMYGLLGDEGEHSERGSLFYQATTVGSGNLFYGVKCDEIWFGLPNTSSIEILSIDASNDSNKSATLCWFLNPGTSGVAVYTQNYPSKFPLSWDTSLTWTGNDDVLLLVQPMAKVDSLSTKYGGDDRVLLYPGDTLICTVTTAAASDISIGITFKVH